MSQRADNRHLRLERLAWLLDSALPVPFLRTRFGLDSLVGLIPGAGDLLTSLLSAYIFFEGVRMRVPKSLLVRMGWNVGVDTALGAIPLVGDLFDVIYRSNRRNVQLLQAHAAEPPSDKPGSRFWLWLIALVMLAPLALLVWGIVVLSGAVWGALFG